MSRLGVLVGIIGMYCVFSMEIGPKQPQWQPHLQHPYQYMQTPNMICNIICVLGRLPPQVGPLIMSQSPPLVGHAPP